MWKIWDLPEVVPCQIIVGNLFRHLALCPCTALPMLPNKEMCSSLSTSMCHKFFFYRTQFLLVFRKFLATHFPSWYKIRNDLYQYFVIGAHWYQNISNKADIDQEQRAVLVCFERGLVQFQNVQFLLLFGWRAMLTCALQSIGVNSDNVALHVCHKMASIGWISANSMSRANDGNG